MIETALPSPSLRTFIQTYVHNVINVENAIVKPVPARTAEVLEFTFANAYRVHRYDRPDVEAAYPVAVIGSQTYRRVDLELAGHIDNFVVVFQPLGLQHLFGIRGPELANQHFDAAVVLGPTLTELASKLNATSSFQERIRIANVFFLNRGSDSSVDVCPFTRIAREILNSTGSVRIPTLADQAGLSLRQFERRFMQHFGVSPKLYCCIARFEAAVQARTYSSKRSWTAIAHQLGYHDQMHMVHDFRRLTGGTPTSIWTQLEPFSERRAEIET